MALDRWLLQQHRLSHHPPTLRFYTWSPAAISLGYHQKRFPEFWREICWAGKPLDLVRRPTGGRAVLHQGDLTYMVVTSITGKSPLEAYLKISEFLIEGWRNLGVQLQYGEAKRNYVHNPNCFATTTGADLIDSRGNKLIGSAQLRQGNAILQHGSMLLNVNPQLFAQVFAVPPPPPRDFSPEEILKNLTESAIHCFEIELITQPLTEMEWKSVFLGVQD
jgi:lipoate-protein ligase A